MDKEKEKKELFKKIMKEQQALINIKVNYPRSNPKWLLLYDVYSNKFNKH